MIAVIAISSLVLVAWAVSRASAPASQRSRARDTDRRARHVARHPQHVNSGDIERLLLDASLSPTEARMVVELAAEHGIHPFTMWMWVQQYDARTLAVVVTADLTHVELLTHLGKGTVPDLEELQLFASLNGLAATERPIRTPVKATVVPRASLRHNVRSEERAPVSTPMPPIFEPGSWPYTEWDVDGQSSLPDFRHGSGDGLAA